MNGKMVRILQEIFEWQIKSGTVISDLADLNSVREGLLDEVRANWKGGFGQLLNDLAVYGLVYLAPSALNDQNDPI